MQFSEINKRALEIRAAYDQLNISNGQKIWDLQECVQGFVGDVGDLVKLAMMKDNLRRSKGDVDAQLKHELSDCLWSILTIADKLNIDLESEFMQTMDELEEKVSK